MRSPAEVIASKKSLHHLAKVQIREVSVPKLKSAILKAFLINS